MAYMILLPDGASGHTSFWTVNTGTHEDALGSDDGDTTYVTTSSHLRYLDLTYANPSLAESLIETIESVRFLSSGRSTDRANPAAVNIGFTGTGSAYLETVAYNPHASSYTDVNGTSRTTYDGSNAWTYSKLEDLTLRATKNASIGVRLSYLVLEIRYFPVENSVFFGTNF